MTNEQMLELYVICCHQADNHILSGKAREEAAAERDRLRARILQGLEFGDRYVGLCD